MLSSLKQYDYFYSILDKQYILRVILLLNYKIQWNLIFIII